MSIEINKINLKNQDYYLSNELITLDPSFFIGCNSNTRLIIDKKGLTEKDYIFGYIKNNQWIISKSSYARSKLLLSALWVENNVPKIIILNKKNDILNTNDNIEELYDISPAPEILYLDDDEKFKDNDNNILEIETRGEKHPYKIFFRVKDVSKIFEMPNLNSSLLHKKDNLYKEGIHYKYFTIQKIKNNKSIIVKELFINYNGLLKILFNIKDSRTKEINIVDIIKNQFKNINWICNKPLKSLYRPDMYTIINNNILMIEVDENQHKNYDQILEEQRIDTIYKELNKKNMTIIRINPDSYIDSNKIFHNSIIEDNNEFNLRMNIIIKIINENIKNPQKKLNINKLFYDNYIIDNTINTNNDFNYIQNNKYIRLSQIRDNIIKRNFIFDFGTTEQKDKLVSNIKGVSYETIQELFNVNANKIPCVYLTAFNTVSNLRSIMNINNSYADDDVVYKFGLTKSFESRKNGHTHEYKELKEKIDMKLTFFTFIDPLYIGNAETEIKQLLVDYKINYNNHDELVVIPNKLLKFIKETYEKLGMKYSGHTQQMKQEIEKLNKQIIETENKIEMQKLKYENKIKEYEYEIKLQKERYENELLKKELELLKLKNNIK